MRIARLDCLYADAGWRNFSFLKLVTDEGLVGWAEFNDGFGAGGDGLGDVAAGNVPVLDPDGTASWVCVVSSPANGRGPCVN